MTFFAFRPFCRQKHRNDVIVMPYIKISQILKLKSKDITSKTPHATFYASRIKTSELEGGKIPPPQVWSVFKSPGKIGLKLENFNSWWKMAAHMQKTSHLHYICSIQFFHIFYSVTELKIDSTEFFKVGSISFNQIAFIHLIHISTSIQSIYYFQFKSPVFIQFKSWRLFNPNISSYAVWLF